MAERSMYFIGGRRLGERATSSDAGIWVEARINGDINGDALQKKR